MANFSGGLMLQLLINSTVKKEFWSWKIRRDIWTNAKNEYTRFSSYFRELGQL